ncbi:hypothetical protein CCMSSC00406_0010082 [Pleurotus cornucopiae]|uniref:Uncharacterized protein n=1 Tax=Pleurotus cornucopiae TaxID=5321 RepID=A0ACB7IKL3_PLECO|nr:hypothetical protein CCMSSC00406_0010082 [Pleurotus cornucopiae]
MPTLTVTLLVVTAALVCLPAVTAQCNPGQFTDGAGACVDCTAGTFSTSKSTHIRKGNLTQYSQMELLLHVALAPQAVLITYKRLWAAALAALDSFRQTAGRLNVMLAVEDRTPQLVAHLSAYVEQVQIPPLPLARSQVAPGHVRPPSLVVLPITSDVVAR